MESCPITSLKIDGAKMEIGAHFIFLGSKITADGDRSHRIKRHLFLGKKIYDKLGSSVHGILQVRILAWVAILF